MTDPVSRLQLRHFRLIGAVAEHGQLSVAADHLAMTQPAASRTLAETERLIGAPLFERHAKGMRPTPVGEVMARHARLLLGGLDQAEAELGAFRAGRSGTVRVGAVTGAAVGFVVPAIRALKREANNPAVRVEVAPSVDLMDSLLNGDLDFVLSRVPRGVEVGRLEVLHGRVEHLALLARSGHPLLRETGLQLKDLAGCAWIAQKQGMPIREAIEQRHVIAGIDPPQDVIESSSLLMTLAYLHGSDAISPVAREVSDLLVGTGSGGVAELPMTERITLSPYHLIRQKRMPISPLAGRLLELVLERLTA
ncbi:LysR substrate-binding domain-containing protein [Psychromarinibacter sp. C21-152]|uniref:LysR substrate-binding domain-containing protein n=1 Tax=Psychromarinibacter sediminicola TaxID=3033385 RepID=A0AAE3T884_9RHOB|nr:LysR substrate-binding domain-containing protein [Psychromarinibacter sediminicola]MDF0599200.1 LysR substrate-binding domain-containing protein [Psychromarinibacter sediminicola]